MPDYKRDCVKRDTKKSRNLFKSRARNLGKSTSFVTVKFSCSVESHPQA